MIKWRKWDGQSFQKGGGEILGNKDENVEDEVTVCPDKWGPRLVWGRRGAGLADHSPKLSRRPNVVTDNPCSSGEAHLTVRSTDANRQKLQKWTISVTTFWQHHGMYWIIRFITTSHTRSHNDTDTIINFLCNKHPRSENWSWRDVASQTLSREIMPTTAVILTSLSSMTKTEQAHLNVR